MTKNFQNKAPPVGAQSGLRIGNPKIQTHFLNYLHQIPISGGEGVRSNFWYQVQICYNPKVPFPGVVGGGGRPSDPTSNF